MLKVYLLKNGNQYSIVNENGIVISDTRYFTNEESALEWSESYMSSYNEFRGIFLIEDLKQIINK